MCIRLYGSVNKAVSYPQYRLNEPVQECFNLDKMLVGVLYQVLLVAGVLRCCNNRACIKLIMLCSKSNLKAEIVKLCLNRSRVVRNTKIRIVFLYKRFFTVLGGCAYVIVSMILSSFFSVLSCSRKKSSLVR